MPRLEGFSPNSNTVILVFPNADIADFFKTWMCDAGGEQHFDSACEHYGRGGDFLNPTGIKLGADYHTDADKIIFTEYEEVGDA
mgnify:CR=1 FL=1|jgi:hypothetical protein|tara:strand:+ start:750 stop:1001 length:252 start_codon:yes stop_codon:yes gene_type:complete